MTVLYAHLFKIWFGLFRPNLIGEEFMWKLLPLPEGPKQKKFELSVSLFFPSFPVMSIATGTPWRSV